MSIKIPRRHPFGLRRFTLCLMMLALSLRALVPAGFMPDAGALRDGRLEMTFCTSAGGFKTFAVAGHGAATSSSDGEHTRQAADCPFNILTSLAAMPSMAPALAGLPLLAWPVLLAPHRAAQPLAPAQGPPLGSRAPPIAE
jgi:hypothetical protein